MDEETSNNLSKTKQKITFSDSFFLAFFHTYLATYKVNGLIFFLQRAGLAKLDYAHELQLCTFTLRPFLGVGRSTPPGYI